jgi:molybdopterin-guanine dinucleotide biosynthesis protein A
MNLSGILLAGGKSRRLGMNKLQVRIGQVPLLIDQIFKLSFFCREIIVSTSELNFPIIEREIKNIKRHLKHFSEILEIKNICGTDPGDNVRAFLDRAEIKIVLDDLNEIKTGKISRETGPIAGIYSGLNKAANHYSLILAFDMPFVSFRMIKTLVDVLDEDIDFDKSKPFTGETKKGIDAFIIKTEKGFEVLSGIYSKGCMDALEYNISNKDNKISNIFKNIKVRIIEEEVLRSKNLDMLNFFNINRIEDYNRFEDIWSNEFLKCLYAAKSGDTFFKRWAGFFFR